MANTDPSIPSAETSAEHQSLPGDTGAGTAGESSPAGERATSPAPTGAAPHTKPVPQRPGVLRRTTNNVKRFMLVLLGVILTLFAVSNSQDVKVRWVFGDPVLTPLILVIAITFVLGASIGWLFAKLGGRHHDAP